MGLSQFSQSKFSQVTVDDSRIQQLANGPRSAASNALTVSNISSAAARHRLGVIGSREDLDSCAILSIQHGNVLDINIGNNVGDAVVLTEGTDRDAV